MIKLVSPGKFSIETMSDKSFSDRTHYLIFQHSWYTMGSQGRGTTPRKMSTDPATGHHTGVRARVMKWGIMSTVTGYIGKVPVTGW